MNEVIKCDTTEQMEAVVEKLKALNHKWPYEQTPKEAWDDGDRIIYIHSYLGSICSRKRTSEPTTSAAEFLETTPQKNEMEELKERIERLEKEVRNKSYIQWLSEKDKTVSCREKLINIKEQVGPNATYSEYHDKISEAKEESLTVDGILEKYNFSKDALASTGLGHINILEHLPKKIKALWKLLIIADYVNDGWKWEDPETYYYPVFEVENPSFWTIEESRDNFSPIKLSDAGSDLLVTIKGVDQLIRDYLE